MIPALQSLFPLSSYSHSAEGGRSSPLQEVQRRYQEIEKDTPAFARYLQQLTAICDDVLIIGSFARALLGIDPRAVSPSLFADIDMIAFVNYEEIGQKTLQLLCRCSLGDTEAVHSFWCYYCHMWQMTDMAAQVSLFFHLFMIHAADPEKQFSPDELQEKLDEVMGSCPFRLRHGYSARDKTELSRYFQFTVPPSEELPELQITFRDSRHLLEFGQDNARACGVRLKDELQGVVSPFFGDPKAKERSQEEYAQLLAMKRLVIPQREFLKNHVNPFNTSTLKLVTNWIKDVAQGWEVEDPCELLMQFFAHCTRITAERQSSFEWMDAICRITADYLDNDGYLTLLKLYAWSKERPREWEEKVQEWQRDWPFIPDFSLLEDSEVPRALLLHAHISEERWKVLRHMWKGPPQISLKDWIFIKSDQLQANSLRLGPDDHAIVECLQQMGLEADLWPIARDLLPRASIVSMEFFLQHLSISSNVSVPDFHVILREGLQRFWTPHAKRRVLEQLPLIAANYLTTALAAPNSVSSVGLSTWCSEVTHLLKEYTIFAAPLFHLTPRQKKVYKHNQTPYAWDLRSNELNYWKGLLHTGDRVCVAAALDCMPATEVPEEILPLLSHQSFKLQVLGFLERAWKTKHFRIMPQIIADILIHWTLPTLQEIQVERDCDWHLTDATLQHICHTLAESRLPLPLACCWAAHGCLVFSRTSASNQRTFFTKLISWFPARLYPALGEIYRDINVSGSDAVILSWQQIATLAPDAGKIVEYHVEEVLKLRAVPHWHEKHMQPEHTALVNRHCSLRLQFEWKVMEMTHWDRFDEKEWQMTTQLCPEDPYHYRLLVRLVSLFDEVNCPDELLIEWKEKLLIIYQNHLFSKVDPSQQARVIYLLLNTGMLGIEEIPPDQRSLLAQYCSAAQISVCSELLYQAMIHHIITTSATLNWIEAFNRSHNFDEEVAKSFFEILHQWFREKLEQEILQTSQNFNVLNQFLSSWSERFPTAVEHYINFAKLRIAHAEKEPYWFTTAREWQTTLIFSEQLAKTPELTYWCCRKGVAILWKAAPLMATLSKWPQGMEALAHWMKILLCEQIYRCVTTLPWQEQAANMRRLLHEFSPFAMQLGTMPYAIFASWLSAFLNSSAPIDLKMEFVEKLVTFHINKAPIWIEGSNANESTWPLHPWETFLKSLIQTLQLGFVARQKEKNKDVPLVRLFESENAGRYFTDVFMAYFSDMLKELPKGVKSPSPEYEKNRIERKNLLQSFWKILMRFSSFTDEEAILTANYCIYFGRNILEVRETTAHLTMEEPFLKQLFQRFGWESALNFACAIADVRPCEDPFECYYATPIICYMMEMIHDRNIEEDALREQQLKIQARIRQLLPEDKDYVIACIHLLAYCQEKNSLYRQRMMLIVIDIVVPLFFQWIFSAKELSPLMVDAQKMLLVLAADSFAKKETDAYVQILQKHIEVVIHRLQSPDVNHMLQLMQRHLASLVIILFLQQSFCEKSLERVFMLLLPLAVKQPFFEQVITSSFEIMRELQMTETQATGSTLNVQYISLDKRNWIQKEWEKRICESKTL